MAYGFNGSTDYIQTALTLGTLTNSRSNTAPFSLACLAMKTTGAGSFPVCIAPTTGANGGSTFLLFGQNVGAGLAGPTFYLLGGQCGTSTTMTLDTWYSLVGTYDGNTTTGLKMYVNGTSVGTHSGTVGAYAGADADIMAIGSGVTGGNSYWKGNMAEIGMWNVALDAAEAAALAAGYSPRFIRPASLLEYVPLVRDNVSFKNAAPTLSGTSVTDHPRIIYPKRKAA